MARIVASIATSPMLSITASRIGPRSLRSPTSARRIGGRCCHVLRQPERAAICSHCAPVVVGQPPMSFTVRGGDCREEQASVAGAEIRNRDFFVTFCFAE